MILFSLITALYQGDPHSSRQREGKFVAKAGLSKEQPNYFSDMREGDGLVLNNDPHHDHKHSTSGRSTTTNGPHRVSTHSQAGRLERTRSNYKDHCNQDSHLYKMTLPSWWYKTQDTTADWRIFLIWGYTDTTPTHGAMDEGRHGMVIMI